MEPIPQVGAIAFRKDHQPPQILLVRAKKDPEKWIFPKGHIEPGEQAADAVLRELEEEAGVVGVRLGPIGPPQTFQSGEEFVRVQYHLVCMKTERPSPEGREKQWLPAGEAAERLSFQSARELLLAALPEIDRYPTPIGGGSAGDAFDEYLRAEFEHVAESLLKSEEDGEKRATFFVTLTGAVGAALGFVVGGEGGLLGAGRLPLVVASLAVLLAMGYLTFVRIVSRNVATDSYKRRLNRVRRYFLDGKRDRLAFVPFDPYKPEGRTLWSWNRIGKGGWLETLVLVNALIFGALVAVIVSDGAAVMAARGVRWVADPDGIAIGCVSILAGIVSAALAWGWLMAHGTRRYRRETWRAREGLIVERAVFGKVNGAADRWVGRAKQRLGCLGWTDVKERPYEPRSPAVDQLLFLASGGVTFTDVARNETVRVRPGDLLFIPANVVPEVEEEAEDKAPTRCVVGVPKNLD